MSLKSGLLEVREIFSHTIFRIPDYQRGYSWQLKQLNEFWEDLLNIREEKYHYTGVLTIEKITEEVYANNKKWEIDKWLFVGNRVEPFHIVDGQQRITTIIILISLLINSIKGNEIDLYTKDELTKKYISINGNNGKSYIFGYDVDNPSDRFFKAHILGVEKAESPLTDTLYTKNIANAKRFFQRKIDDLSENKRVELFVKITNQLVFNVYIIDNDMDVSVAFETMNNRGIALSKLELLKNRLIYLTTMLENSEDEQSLRVTINQCWKTIYEYLGKKISLKDDAFLKDHWIMYFGNYSKNEEDAFAVFLLEKYFVLRNLNIDSTSQQKIDPREISKYVESIEDSIFHWFIIFYPDYKKSKLSQEEREWLLRLKDLGRGSFVPLIMAAMSVKNINNDFLSLLKCIERYVFLVFKVSQRRSDAGNTKIYKYAYELFSKKTTINNILKNINQAIYMESGMYYYGFFDIDRFKNHIKDCYVNPLEGKYGYLGWSKIKYFLCEYEINLQKEQKAEPNSNVGILDKNTEIKLASVVYKKKWKETNKRNEQEKQYVLYSLGNLFLCQTKPQNLNNSNNTKHIKTCSQIEIESYSEWTEDLILQRGIKMFEFFEKRWDIPVGDKEYIKELLFMDFL